MDSDWAWATQSRYPGFCLSFVRDRDPATVAELLGGGPLETMTVEEAVRVFPPSRRGALLRCGTVPGWAYCYEDYEPVGFQRSLLQRLSAGTEVVQILKSGDGMTIARRMVDGRQTEQFEPRRGAASRGDGPAVLLPRVERTLSNQPGTSGLLAALHAVGEHVGTVISRQELDGPLPTTFSTFVEPDPAPRPPIRPQGLGRTLGTITFGDTGTFGNTARHAGPDGA
jgi:hypothetical protein